MKLTIKLDRLQQFYELRCEGMPLERIHYATTKQRKVNPVYALCMNMDEARIHAKQRAQFYDANVR